jgi:hypothetical protein
MSDQIMRDVSRRKGIRIGPPMSSDSTPRTAQPVTAADVWSFDYDKCPHGNGLSCRDCDLEAEADDATWD